MGGAPTASDLRKARWAVTVVFASNGLLLANLAARTPSLKGDLHFSATQIGVISAVFGLTAVAAMQTTGGLTARFGSRAVIRCVMPPLPILLAGIGVAPNFLTIAVLHIAFGALHGVLDVSMNAHAVTVERALKRHIINGCHAAWSLGAVAGALLGALVAEIDVSRGWHYTALAMALVPACFVTGQNLLPTRIDHSDMTNERRIPAAWRAGWTPQLLAFGAIGATVLATEAAAADWSGVFLYENRGASLGLAGMAYVAFACSQTALRLIGDRIQIRVSAEHLLRWGGAVAAAGMAVVVLSPWAWLGVVGFGVTGLALATSLPVLFGVVGHLGADHPGGADAGAATTISRFSTMTYAGIFLGPAVIGWVADLVGLTWTLAMLIPLLLTVAAGAGIVGRARPIHDAVAMSGDKRA
uniref:MFS transporter n=1 Tax=Nonomuraea bangladeshensis TaxID=404385 RepID=UPI003F493F79